jgi:uncharacterized protein YecT (DUF1311 family)
MNVRQLLIAAGLACAVPSLAVAAGCDAPQTGFDNVYCFAKVYMDLDRQLNDSYVALMHAAKPAEKDLLRTGQRDWIALRNNQCYHPTGAGNAVNIDCALATTRSRIQFLSDRLAECRATGCNDARLARVTETPHG